MLFYINPPLKRNGVKVYFISKHSKNIILNVFYRFSNLITATACLYYIRNNMLRSYIVRISFFFFFVLVFKLLHQQITCHVRTSYCVQIYIYILRLCVVMIDDDDGFAILLFFYDTARTGISFSEKGIEQRERAQE